MTQMLCSPIWPLRFRGCHRNAEFIVVDGITNLAQVSQVRSVMGFFSSCQQQCDDGRTIVVVGRPSAFDQDLLARLHGLCVIPISAWSWRRH